MNRKQLKAEKQRLLVDLTMLDPAGNEYKQTLKMLERLEKLKPRFRPSVDTIITASASLLGILIIVAYEEKHVFASKAQGFIPKLK